MSDPQRSQNLSSIPSSSERLLPHGSVKKPNRRQTGHSVYIPIWSLRVWMHPYKRRATLVVLYDWRLVSSTGPMYTQNTYYIIHKHTILDLVLSMALLCSCTTHCTSPQSTPVARRHVTVSTLTRNNVMTVTRRVTVSRLSTGEGPWPLAAWTAASSLANFLACGFFIAVFMPWASSPSSLAECPVAEQLSSLR